MYIKYGKIPCHLELNISIQVDFLEYKPSLTLLETPYTSKQTPRQRERLDIFHQPFNKRHPPKLLHQPPHQHPSPPLPKDVPLLTPSLPLLQCARTPSSLPLPHKGSHPLPSGPSSSHHPPSLRYPRRSIRLSRPRLVHAISQHAPLRCWSFMWLWLWLWVRMRG